MRDEGLQNDEVTCGPKRALEEVTGNDDSARGVPVESTGTENGNTGTGTGIMKPVGLDDGKMKSCTEESTLGYDDMAESTERCAATDGATERFKDTPDVEEGATERFKDTPDVEEGATERSKDTPDVGEGATERSQAASGDGGKILGKKEAGEPSYDTGKYRDALRTGTEGAESVVTGLQSSMVGAVQANTAESGVREVDGRGTHGTVPARSYQRLFTDKELDMLEGRGVTTTKTELEEYDKELEDRLFPLDEVAIRRRAERNAEGQGQPGLEDLSVELGIPVDVLERTRDVSTGDLDTPEYWLDWYSEAVEKSAEAKRPNRDFREGGEGYASKTGVVNSVSASEENTLSLEGLAEDATEREFVRNVCMSLEEVTDPTVREAEVPEGTGTPLFSWRSTVRRWVYQSLKRTLKEREGPPPEEQEEEGLGDEITPLRDKEELGLNTRSLRDHLLEIDGTLDEASLDQVLRCAKRYYEVEASAMRGKIIKRERSRVDAEIDSPSTTIDEADTGKRVTFELPPEPAKSEIADEAPEVLTVNTGRTRRPRRRPGLIETDSAGEERVVPVVNG
ncbi:hypothetical protein DVH05_017983 [Phytophthora capsici]|nr:hypothetical protein DVH05_017983 [Phytophthora capsici]